MILGGDAWPGLRVHHRLSGGERNAVHLGDLDGRRVVARRSSRSAASLEWELDLLELLAARGFRVPETIRTAAGGRVADGVVVQTWVEGRPPDTGADWEAVAQELQRLHRAFSDHPQRPGACRVTELAVVGVSVDADLAAVPTEMRDEVAAIFAGFPDVAASVIHGDPGPGNIRIDERGRVGFIDWDESRVDLVWHDLSNLGVQVLGDEAHHRAQLLSHAWEAVNAWTVEPTYARGRLDALRALTGRATR